MLTAVRRVWNAARAAGAAALKAPAPGRIAAPRAEDFNDAVNIDLRPERVKAMLVAAVNGDPAAQDEILDDVLDRDGDLVNARRTRRIAVTGLEWEVVSAVQVGRAGKVNESLAEEAADYCREVLARISGFGAMLSHLADAVGRGTMAAELEWDTVAGEGGGRRQPVVAWTILAGQLRFDPRERERLRVATIGDWRGLALDEQPAGKFIVHTPDRAFNSFFRGALLRPSIILHLGKRMGWKAWQVGIEMFGLPLTIAKVDPNAPAETKSEVLKVLNSLGVIRGGMFPLGSEIELKEFQNPGVWPHERIIAFVNESYAKLWLGQTLTTQVGETGGALAAAAIHNEVRQDIRDEDIRLEGETIREQLLRPLVLYRFGERALSVVPEFRRIVEEARDTEIDGRVLSIAVNDLGLLIPQRYASEQLGIPLVRDADGDAPIPGRQLPAGQGFDPFGGLREPAGVGAAANLKLRRTANSLFSTLRQRRSRISALLPWMMAAAIASQAHTADVVAAIDARLVQVDDERTPAAATAALAGLIDTLPIDDLAELQRQLLVASELRGRATAQATIGRHRGDRTRAASAALLRTAHAQINFARLPFLEAIEALRERLGITPEQFERLDAQARSRAFRIAGVTNMQLLADAHRELVSALEAGETIRDFRRRALAITPPPGEVGFAERNGWTGENPWHANLVQFQNTAMAYAAGSYQQLSEAGVPAWRFVNNGESCPICEPEIGKVYRISDSDRIPPLHFGCDCDHEPVFEEELGAAALNDSSREPNPALDKSRAPAGGFKFDVRHYGNLEPLDLGRYPPELREAFERFAVQRGWRFA